MNNIPLYRKHIAKFEKLVTSGDLTPEYMSHDCIGYLACVITLHGDDIAMRLCKIALKNY